MGAAALSYQFPRCAPCHSHISMPAPIGKSWLPAARHAGPSASAPSFSSGDLLGRLFVFVDALAEQGRGLRPAPYTCDRIKHPTGSVPTHTSISSRRFVLRGTARAGHGQAESSAQGRASAGHGGAAGGATEPERLSAQLGAAPALRTRRGGR